jgi:hypothetical protein
VELPGLSGGVSLSFLDALVLPFLFFFLFFFGFFYDAAPPSLAADGVGEQLHPVCVRASMKCTVNVTAAAFLPGGAVPMRSPQP